MTNADDIVSRLSTIIRTTFAVPDGTIVDRETTSFDIEGWDSLSYSVLIMNVEEAFGLSFDFQQIFTLANVGELANLIGERR